MNSEMNNKVVDGVCVTSLLLKTLENATKEYARECIRRCALSYGFDAEEAMCVLNLEKCQVQVKEMKKRSAAKTEKKVVEKKVAVVKGVHMPLPFVEGAINEEGCSGLAYNSGLFTQCRKQKMLQSVYCKVCQQEADASASGAPTTGTVKGRLSVGMMEYRDGKGRKPVAYTKIMAKNGLSREAVEAEAGKLNITIDEVHFDVVQEEDKKNKKTVKGERSAAGRPKSVKKSKVVSAESVDDLFAQLVDEEDEVSMTSTVLVSESESESESEEEDKEEIARQFANEKALRSVEQGHMKEADAEMKKIVKSEKKEEEMAAKTIAKEQKMADELIAKELKAQKLIEEKEAKAQKLIEEKAAKEQKLIDDLAAREQKIIDDLAAKEAKAQKLIEEKEAKAQKLIDDKAAKEQKLIEEKEAKAQKLIDDKAAKEQKLIDDKAAKEQKIADELIAKELKAQKLIEEKAAKAQKLIEEKAAKEQKLIDDKAAKAVKAVKAAKAPEPKKAAEKKAPEPKTAEEPVAPAVSKKVKVLRITIDGKEYLKTADNMLYDPLTKEEMGIYEAETNTIKALPDEDEDEIEEDGYDSDN